MWIIWGTLLYTEIFVKDRFKHNIFWKNPCLLKITSTYCVKSWVGSRKFKILKSGVIINTHTKPLVYQKTNYHSSSGWAILYIVNGAINTHYELIYRQHRQIDIYQNSYFHQVISVRLQISKTWLFWCLRNRMQINTWKIYIKVGGLGIIHKIHILLFSKIIMFPLVNISDLKNNVYFAQNLTKDCRNNLPLIINCVWVSCG